jgi:hypothetical protein
MLAAAIHLELLGHRATEPVLGEHALDRPLDDAVGMGPQHGLGVHFLEPADVPGVPAVLLVLQLPAGELDLLRVDDHHVIADIQMRAEARLVLAAEDRGHARGEATEHLSLRIDQIPLPLDIALLGHRRRHDFPFDRPKYA